MTLPPPGYRRLLAAPPLLLALLLAACFWQNSEGVDSPRAQSMAAFITASTDIYNTRGPDAFWDLLVEEIKTQCSRESFVQAVSDEPAPVTFKGLRDVDFRDRRALASIDFVTSQGDMTIEWQLIELDNGTWRIEQIPGMQDCTP